MNNNYDQGQQGQQYQYDTQYRAPLYQQPALPDTTPMLIMAIIGLALTVSGVSTIAAIILCIISLSKVKAFIDAGGYAEGKAKIAKILATVGIVHASVTTVLAVIGVILYFVMGLGSFLITLLSYGFAFSAYEDSYDYYSDYYYY